jgi:hypothetical protein
VSTGRCSFRPPIGDAGVQLSGEGMGGCRSYSLDGVQHSKRSYTAIATNDVCSPLCQLGSEPLPALDEGVNLVTKGFARLLE